MLPVDHQAEPIRNSDHAEPPFFPPFVEMPRGPYGHKSTWENAMILGFEDLQPWSRITISTRRFCSRPLGAVGAVGVFVGSDGLTFSLPVDR